MFERDGREEKRKSDRGIKTNKQISFDLYKFKNISAFSFAQWNFSQFNVRLLHLVALAKFFALLILLYLLIGQFCLQTIHVQHLHNGNHIKAFQQLIFSSSAIKLFLEFRYPFEVKRFFFLGFLVQFQTKTTFKIIWIGFIPCSTNKPISLNGSIIHLN